MSACKVHEVTKNELDILLSYLKLIANRTDRVISVEVEKDKEVSHTLTFNPRSSKRKISILTKA